MIQLARTLSVVLHPVYIPLAFVLLIFNLNTYPFTFLSSTLILFVLALVFVFNIMTPLLVIYTMKRLNVIGSVFLDQRRERIFPLFVYAMLLYLTSMISKKWGLPALWEVIILLSAMLTLLTIIITFFYRISLHMTSWGALTGLVVSLIYYFHAEYFIWLSAVIFLSGLAAWSRAVLQKHKAGELITGFVLGFLLISAGLFFVISINTG